MHHHSYVVRDDDRVEHRPTRRARWASASAAVALAVGAVTVASPSVRADLATCEGLGTSLASLCVESSADGATQAPYATDILRGQRITEFQWLVNEDSTGDPTNDATTAALCAPVRAGGVVGADGRELSDCPWPSVHAVKGHADVVGSGTEGDVDRLAQLPAGRYLLSVTASGFKIDGVHFEVGAGHVLLSVNDVAVGEPRSRFIVRMNPLPKKTATLRVHVYNDNASTNGQWDGQTETLITCADATPAQQIANCGGPGVVDPNVVGDPATDMSGFSVRIADLVGEVTTDVFGNPLCTEYVKDALGNVLLDGDGAPLPLRFGGTLTGTESTCLSDHYGDIVIPNLGPNRYAVSVIPPDPISHDGIQWMQTTTLEGGHDWDSWNLEGGTGFDTELIVGGERVTPIAHGFVRMTHGDAQREAYAVRMATQGLSGDALLRAVDSWYYDASTGFDSPAPSLGVLTGRIMIGRAYIGSGSGVALAGANLANAREFGPIEDGLISISCIATCHAPTDEAVWTGRAAADGTFRVTGLQTGDYVVSFWDESQSYILAVMQYHVDGNQRFEFGTLPAVTSASVAFTRTGRTYTLRFASTPTGVVAGDTLSLSGGDNGWDGLFTVQSLSGSTVLVRKASGSAPSATAVVLPIAKKVLLPGIDPAPTDVGHILLPGWFTDLKGSVFVDCNGDGIRQDGQSTDPTRPACFESGIPDFTVSVRTRGNSLQDQGASTSRTDDVGEFDLGQAYPLGQFLVVEAYDPRFHTTGVTYQADNDVPHTIITSQVDFDFLPVIGLSATLDVGVMPYDEGENGGIAGTVTYDVTRNEFDPAHSVQEDYQPGVAGIPMQLWKVQREADGTVTHDEGSGAVVQVGRDSTSGQECVRPDGLRGTDAVADPEQTCKPFDYYITESWNRPTGCLALDLNGNKLLGELALPASPADGSGVDYSHTDPNEADCIESPMNGFQIGGDGTVDGNYALSALVSEAISSAPTDPDALAAWYAEKASPSAWDALVPDDYVVEAVNPIDELGSVVLDAPDPDQGGNTVGPQPKKKYRFTDETSLNVFTGDTYVPSEGYTCATQSGSCAGAGPSAGPTMGYDPDVVAEDPNTLSAGTAALCAGSLQTIVDDNPDIDGGTPFIGGHRAVCDAKLVHVSNGRSVNPTFFMYTDVPLPAKFYGLLNDDLNVQTDRHSTLLGEVAPVSNAPIGIYDENNNWKFTAHSDANGNYEVLLPSMDTYNCPLPAGPCPNVYRLVGNDPGTLDHRNLDFNPQFRTIATNFQAWAGVVHPVDQAPTHQGITIEGPGSQFGALSLCKVNDASTFADATKTVPEIFAIDRPYYVPATPASGLDPGSPGDSAKEFVVSGIGFGTRDRASRLMLGTLPASIVSWSDRTIRFKVPASLSSGGYQLTVHNRNGLENINGLTFHILATGTDSSYYRLSDVYEVRAADPAGSAILTDDTARRIFTPAHDAWDRVTDTPNGFDGTDRNGLPVKGGRAIQRAIEAAHTSAYGSAGRWPPVLGDARPKLIVIYPNTASNYASHNADAAYFENVVLHGKVTLQGVGTGGAYSATDIVHGTTIDASLFWASTQAQPTGTNLQIADGTYSGDWRTFVDSLPAVGSSALIAPEGEAIYAIAETKTQWANLTATVTGALGTYLAEDLSAPASKQKAGVDGMVITGGNQQGNVGNVNTVPGSGGTTTVVAPGPAQGGAVTLAQYVRDFHITNNVVRSNGGTYGVVRIGSPDVPLSRFAAELGENVEVIGQIEDNHDERLNVSRNRFIANGGTMLAGALGIFSGADLYRVTDNDFCGNTSSEYGGAITHYGPSGGGTIARNRIYYNQGYDEGGGVMIAGNLPANNTLLSSGAGASYTTVSSGVLVAHPRAGVTIDANNIIANLTNDDGGGIRFLMAGDFPFVVSNNVIANNVATHEGGGIALDDAPNVTVVNNTIVKNITTATAATNAAIAGDIRPANPAGLSTGGNSALLQATLPIGVPNWSKPVLINNLFADNRAGWAELPTATNYNSSAIHGIGDPGDSAGVQRWDIGISSSLGLCNATDAAGSCPVGSFPSFSGVDGNRNTTNTSSALQHTNSFPTTYVAAGADNLPGDSDGTASLQFVNPTDFVVDSLGWRVNTNISFPVIVAHFVPFRLLANYHLRETSPAVDAGANPSATNPVPTTDLDGHPRPQGLWADRGADEFSYPNADLSVLITDGQSQVRRGATTTYTVTVANLGPDDVTDARVTATIPASLTAVSWRCVSGCDTAGTGALDTVLAMASGSVATIEVTGTVSDSAAGTLTTSAAVSSTLLLDYFSVNNSASDTDTIDLPAPSTTLLDDFNRADSTTLSTTLLPWLTTTNRSTTNPYTIRLSSNQAFNAGFTTGQALWAGTGSPFRANQSAEVTLVVSGTGSVVGDALIMKANGSTATPSSFIRIRVSSSSQVTVESTTNSGFSFTNLRTFVGLSPASGQTLTATVNADGSVDVWLNGSYLGRTVTTSFTTGGRMGIQLGANGRVDDFRGN